ncbi:hypothetical protein SAZ11_56410 [Streptomyces sp. FXJ1.4098]|nr:hypothetical protein [Streptomyces sp. FXJ1.4098]
MARAPRIELDSPLPETVDGRQIRAVAFQASRLEYVDKNPPERRPDRGREPGPGGGERPRTAGRGLAGLGFDVVAVDPSAPRRRSRARRRAGDGRGETGEGERAAVRYETAPPGELGVADAAFDLVYYADTFEVTPASTRSWRRGPGRSHRTVC